MSVTFKGMTKSTPQLYRDCLRLINHIAGNSKKGKQIRFLLRNEFRKNIKVTDLQMIEQLKSNAIRGLSNYLMIESMSKDDKLSSRVQNFNQRELHSIGEHDQKGDNNKTS